MSYNLRFDRRFLKQLEALPGDPRPLARHQVRLLADTPRPQQAKELDEHPGYYRLRLPRNHRLVDQVLDDEQVIDLLFIGLKHPHLYEQLGLGRNRDAEPGS